MGNSGQHVMKISKTSYDRLSEKYAYRYSFRYSFIVCGINSERVTVIKLLTRSVSTMENPEYHVIHIKKMSHDGLSETGKYIFLKSINFCRCVERHCGRNFNPLHKPGCHDVRSITAAVEIYIRL